MHKIKIFENFLTKSECDVWINRSPVFTGSYEFEDRTLDITNHFIVNEVKKFLEIRCKCSLICEQAQIQLWPIGSGADLHIHDFGGREICDYNSLLYLNDDYDCGEFITENEIIKPKSGMLTFFDGSKVFHGVREVKNKHRYTLIFWWKNTIFYN